MNNILNNIVIILANPQGDENIGMIARAMKNCEIADLRLINPVEFKTKGAYKWAVLAKDILENAKEFSNLKDALDDISLVVGLTRRKGKRRAPQGSFVNKCKDLANRLQKGKIAFVFGREDDGLNKDELAECELVLSIPASGKFGSLNLAQAVLLVCHEFYRNAIYKDMDNDENFCSRKEVNLLLEQIKNILSLLGYEGNKDNMLQNKIVKQFSGLFGRAGLLRKDVKMFEGLIGRVKQKVK